MNFANIFLTLFVCVLFIGTFLIELSRILEKVFCKIKITGKLKDILISEEKFRYVVVTHIYFDYKYDGKEYRNVRALDSDYISTKTRDNLVKGSEYSIYINPKKPRNICFSNRKYYLRDLISTALMGFPTLVFLIGIIIIIVDFILVI